MIKIFRKPGWKLNDNDKIVNGILKMCERNDGLCPCHHDDEGDKHCPCQQYRENDKCICGLYVKENKDK